MNMKTTKSGIKKFTLAEKLAILEEGRQKGVKATLAKYGLYPATYYYWKRNHMIYGETGLNHKSKKEEDKRVRQLEEENAQLKVLLGEQALKEKMNANYLKKIARGWKKLK